MRQIFKIKDNTQDRDSIGTYDPPNKYSIIERTGGHERVCLHIPDHVANPLGVAQGVCEILNRGRKLILPIYK